jgi:hypothetical protein
MPPKQQVIIEVDPRKLRVNPSRMQGAEPSRLQSQISQFGKSKDGMPPLWVARTSDDELVILNGMTRATRIAKLSPGTTVPVEITEQWRTRGAKLPTIGERLP